MNLDKTMQPDNQTDPGFATTLSSQFSLIQSELSIDSGVESPSNHDESSNCSAGDSQSGYVTCSSMKTDHSISPNSFLSVSSAQNHNNTENIHCPSDSWFSDNFSGAVSNVESSSSTQAEPSQECSQPSITISATAVSQILRLYQQVGEEPPEDLKQCVSGFRGFDNSSAKRRVEMSQNVKDQRNSASGSSAGMNPKYIKTEPVEADLLEEFEVTTPIKTESSLEHDSDALSSVSPTDGNSFNDSSSSTVIATVAKVKSIGSLQKPELVKLSAPCRQKTAVKVIEESITCNLCSEVVSCQDVVTHFKSVHTGATKCIVCAKQCRLFADTVKHLVLHTGIKPYKCELCGQGFPLKGALSVHMRSHAGDKKFKCDICERGFNRNEHLKMHMVTHSDEKQFTCNICGKQFGRESTLKLHIMYHTKELNFSCPYCYVNTATKSDLKKHMRVHSTEKPYECEICGKSTAWIQSHRNHMATHHKKHEKIAKNQQTDGKESKLTDNVGSPMTLNTRQEVKSHVTQDSLPHHGS